MELQPILHVWLHQDNDLVDLTITSTKQGKAANSSSEVVHTNQKHPFLTVEKGFLPVGLITVGVHVVEANGQVGVISGWKSVPGVQTMYNLEVAQDHTFVVGVGMWVVHNCTDPAPSLSVDKPTVALGETMPKVRQAAASLEDMGFQKVVIYETKMPTPTVAADIAWLRYWVVKKGAQVVDIGIDNDRAARSVFYDAEIQALKRWKIDVFGK